MGKSEKTGQTASLPSLHLSKKTLATSLTSLALPPSGRCFAERQNQRRGSRTSSPRKSTMTCPARCDQFLSNYIQILVISSNEFHAQKTEVKTTETNAMCGFKGPWLLIIQIILCTTIYTPQSP